MSSLFMDYIDLTVVVLATLALFLVDRFICSLPAWSFFVPVGIEIAALLAALVWAYVHRRKRR